MRSYSGSSFSDTEYVSMLELIYPRKSGKIYRTFKSCILISVLYVSLTSQGLSSTPKSLSLLPTSSGLFHSLPVIDSFSRHP
jgi:hypothetical protein